MYAIPKADVLYDVGPGLGEAKRSLSSAERAEMVDRHESFVEEMTKATVAGLTGETVWGSPIDPDSPNAFPVLSVRHDSKRANDVSKAMGDVEMAKGLSDSGFTGARAEILSKEWTTAALLGQMTFSRAQADTAQQLFDLTDEEAAWLQIVPSKLRILVHQLPERAQIEIPLSEQLIVELYSK